jgi:T5SS/PEP-CTERM-associated repeat protein/autotransporter-associated beta strand protein
MPLLGRLGCFIRHGLMLALAGLALVGAGAPAAQAQTTLYWFATDATSDWTDPGNWLIGNALGPISTYAPNTTTNVIIDLPNDGGEDLQPELNLAGFTNSISVGDSSDSNPASVLSLLGIGCNLTSTGAVIGNQAGSDGSVVVGIGAIWNIANPLQIGNSGTGLLTINQRGTVNVPTAVMMTNNPGSAGEIIVTDPGSTLNTFALYDGSAGSIFSSLQIANGGTVNTTVLSIGGNAGAIVINPGSTLSINGTGGLSVGAAGLGSGVFNISEGGEVTNTYGYIGEGGAGNNGVVNVHDPGSLMANANDLYVGFDYAGDTGGNGTLNITNGGNVTVGGVLYIAANDSTTTGVVNVTNGTLQINGPGGIVMGPGQGTMTFNNGTLLVTSGDLATNVPITSAGGLAFTVNTNGNDVGLSGNISGTGGLVVTGGGFLTLSGCDTYTGLTEVVAGDLQVNGHLAGSPLIVVSGNGSLGGNGTIQGSVQLEAESGFVPGNFDGVGNLTVEGDFQWGGSLVGNATIELELSNAANLTDQLIIGGNFVRGEGDTFMFDFADTGNGTLAVPETYTLISFGAEQDVGYGTFTASDFSYTDMPAGETGTFDLGPNSLTFTVVPEPAAGAVGLAAAVFGLAGVRRIRHAAVR